MKKTPIRILDKNINLLGEIDDYESLIFTRRFFNVGEFELKTNINKKHTDKLNENNLVLLGNQYNKVGIIMHKQFGMDENGESTDTLFVKGYTLKGLASRRLIVPPSVGSGYESIEGSQETILKHFVNKNLVNPGDVNRKISNVAIAPDKLRGKQDKWRSRYENLADKLREIGEYSELGWDIILDPKNKKFIFDVVEGKTLTTDQNTLPPAIFSVDFDSILNREYIESSINYKNIVYAGGKGEEESRLILQKGNSTGFERIETFEDCSSAEDATELSTLAEQKLKELEKIKTFDAKINRNGSFRYEEDYNLGDIVTFQDRKLSVTMNSRIIELREIYDTNGFEVEGVFGNNIPTILDKFKKGIVR